jgi:hypothetical protein
VSNSGTVEEEFCVLVYNAVLATRFTLDSCLAYSATLKMEATWSSETSDNFPRITRHCIPEDTTLHNHRCENLRSIVQKEVDHTEGGNFIETLLRKCLSFFFFLPRLGRRCFVHRSEAKAVL